MVLSSWLAMSVAFVSSSVYWVGVALFKVAAGRMPPLRGDHPVELLVRMLGEPVWLIGAAVVLMGLLLQAVALNALALPAAQPVLVSSVAVLVGIAVGCFSERPTPREWCALLLVTSGTLMVALAASATRSGSASPPSPIGLALLIPPCLLLPVLVFLTCDREPAGLHARPRAGIVFGVTAGVLIGTAELALEGMAQLDYTIGALPRTVYPYLFLVAAGLGVAQLQTALQRHRMVTIAFTATVVAKTHLLVTGTVLYGLLWPRGAALLLLAGGVAVTGLAVTLLPRHEPLP
ncbi:hypothetical protein [Actinomadura fibrosa]|uniref:Uncharacterized protein n=1 Tax=Actinomadura fibrosa TaxID=111802 RepID=A0ABW2X9T3_9ACTN|nr:hypothetical protein [Actinomadura fibrosa]